MPVTPDEMKATLRLWASGVTVVTTANGDIRAGATASSFSSVSLEPPLILVCLYHEAEILKHIETNRHFAVSVLSQGQENVSGQMAGFVDVPDGEDRFFGLDWTTAETGSPILADAVGWLDCTLHAIYDGGTHKIVLGQVQATNQPHPDQPPLLYYDRGYRQLAES